MHYKVIWLKFKLYFWVIYYIKIEHICTLFIKIETHVDIDKHIQNKNIKYNDM